MDLEASSSNEIHAKVDLIIFLHLAVIAEFTKNIFSE